ncbi:hypothetical protein B0H13DRAFT_1898964 [Mycena leptocephala]|nr:hypothetical protein B0H13DRAFT_1898964 [Mycena leptocephala]
MYPDSAYSSMNTGGLYQPDHSQQYQGNHGGTDSDPYLGGQEHAFPYSILQQHAEPTISHSQNYPPLLTEIQNTIVHLSTQLEITTRVAGLAKATAQEVQEVQVKADASTRRQSLKKNKKRSKTQALVQSKTRWLLGIGGIDAKGKIVGTLPHSLGPDQEPELLADNVTKKVHPNWHLGVSDLHNLGVFSRITDLVMDHIEKDAVIPLFALTFIVLIGTIQETKAFYGGPTHAGVMKMTKNYYSTLRRTYSAQNTEEGRTRQARKRELNKRRARKSEKAKDRRAALSRFRQIHGEDNTVGDYDAIQTDDMSSEHSDCGKATQAVFTAHRKSAGGGDSGWEAHRVPRFKGLPANDNHSAPALIRKKPLYEAMVSDTWLTSTNATYKAVGALPTPAHLTIFQLQLTTEGLDKAEQEYLA